MAPLIQRASMSRKESRGRRKRAYIKTPPL
jgi:hypothetical protein